MRYTTIIDLRDVGDLYKSASVRLLYLHLCLACGYHDGDRDKLTKSLRAMAADCGISLAAVRHAVAKLQKAGLLQYKDGVYTVTKWVAADTITPQEPNKTVTKKQKKEQEIQREREQASERLLREREEYKRRERELLRQGKSSWLIYYEGLQKAAAAGDEDARRRAEKYKDMYQQELKRIEEKRKQLAMDA